MNVYELSVTFSKNDNSDKGLNCCYHLLFNGMVRLGHVSGRRWEVKVNWTTYFLLYFLTSKFLEKLEIFWKLFYVCLILVRYRCWWMRHHANSNRWEIPRRTECLKLIKTKQVIIYQISNSSLIRVKPIQYCILYD